MTATTRNRDLGLAADLAGWRSAATALGKHGEGFAGALGDIGGRDGPTPKGLKRSAAEARKALVRCPVLSIEARQRVEEAAWQLECAAARMQGLPLPQPPHSPAPPSQPAVRPARRGPVAPAAQLAAWQTLAGKLGLTGRGLRVKLRDYEKKPSLENLERIVAAGRRAIAPPNEKAALARAVIEMEATLGGLASSRATPAQALVPDGPEAA